MISKHSIHTSQQTDSSRSVSSIFAPKAWKACVRACIGMTGPRSRCQGFGCSSAAASEGQLTRLTNDRW